MESVSEYKITGMIQSSEYEYIRQSPAVDVTGSNPVSLLNTVLNNSMDRQKHGLPWKIMQFL